MDIITLSYLLQNERAAEQYLFEKRILKSWSHCDKCDSMKIGRIRRERYKCYGCKAEWSIRKNSILKNLSMSSSNLIAIIKLFELELTADKTAEEINVNLKTVKNIYHMIRRAISDYDTTEFNDLDLTLKGDFPKFSLTTEGKEIQISLYKGNDTVADLFSLKRSRIPNREIIYLFELNQMHARSIDNSIKYFPIQLNYFWRYARERLLKYKGISLSYLYLYLKEIEFRYNNKELNLFEEIVLKIDEFKGWS